MLCANIAHAPHVAHAASKHAPPHISIPRITAKPQHPEQGKAPRRTHVLGVAVVPGASSKGQVVIQEFTPTNYPGCMRRRMYFTKRDKHAAKLTSAEYIDFLEKVLRTVAKHAPRSMLRKGLVIIHDRDRTHLTKEVTAFCAAAGVRVEALPPRSPDLDPLDYGVFNNAKAWLELNYPRMTTPWKTRCKQFQKRIKATDVKKLTEHYLLRLQAVINTHGGHIEEELRQLKKKAV